MTSEAIQWTTIVMEALAEATKNPNKTIVIDVATADSYELIDDALFALIAEGNEAAWRIKLKNTHYIRSKMKKYKLPDTIDVSYHTLKITMLDPTVALEVGDQQGSYDARGQNIFLDSAIIEEGGARAVSLVFTKRIMRVGIYLI